MFWISLGALILGSVMCWMSFYRKLVLVTWVVWIAGFFGVPMMFETAWPFLALQSLLAIVLVLSWKIGEAT
jgi:hypothetical protein